MVIADHITSGGENQPSTHGDMTALVIPDQATMWIYVFPNATKQRRKCEESFRSFNQTRTGRQVLFRRSQRNLEGRRHGWAETRFVDPLPAAIKRCGRKGSPSLPGRRPLALAQVRLVAFMMGRSYPMLLLATELCRRRM